MHDALAEVSRYIESIPLSLPEWIAMLLLLYGALIGLKNGFLKELASLGGFFVGLFIAWKYYDQVGGGALAFLGLWIITPIALGLAASLVTKLLDWTVVGGLLNRILGCVFGFAKWAMLIVCLTVVTGKTEYVDKYVDHRALPGVSYLEEKWKTLQENL